METACVDGRPPPLLQIGDHVVWISDSGPEFGEVKWLGWLLGFGTQLMVGVEFVVVGLYHLANPILYQWKKHVLKEHHTHLSILMTVWISDTDPEFGEVKWLEKLLDIGTQLIVGVEFDNPVGTGTGKYKNHQLFKAKLNHASLIPITGIMKADVYLGDKSCIRSERYSLSFQTLKQPVMPSCSVCLESLTGETYALLYTHPFHRACLLECVRQRIIK